MYEEKELTGRKKVWFFVILFAVCIFLVLVGIFVF